MTEAALSLPTTEPQMHRASAYAHAFGGLMLRDICVLRREAAAFVVRTVMNPLFFVFVFTYVFPRIGQGFTTGSSVSFGTVILPGLMAIAIMFQGIMAVALPLAIELGVGGELFDRIMAPLPTGGVAAEKIVFSAVQSVIAAGVVFPLAYFIPSMPVHVHVSSWAFLLTVIVLAGLVSGAMGLALGTIAKPQQINLIFAVVVIPVTFLGCVYYPWALLHSVRWLQVLVLLNPLVYMSEGLRAALTPALPHMPSPVVLAALVLSLLILSWIGIRGFVKRVIS
ncbi:MAG TPA: ABC transporter permease [Terriglobales bacterium]|nr:ABC transporter permease [Terriglobales bacterium]